MRNKRRVLSSDRSLRSERATFRGTPEFRGRRPVPPNAERDFEEPSEGLNCPVEGVSLSPMRTGDKYPLAVVVGYGPDHRTVTKLVASIFKNPGQREPVDIEKWFAHEGEGDIRKDPALMGAMVEFIKRHHVTDNVVYNWVWGCPHEEGIDYPEGGVCPHCPFWANLDRHTLEPKSPDLPLTPK